MEGGFVDEHEKDEGKHYKALVLCINQLHHVMGQVPVC